MEENDYSLKWSLEEVELEEGELVECKYVFYIFFMCLNCVSGFRFLYI